MAVSECVSLDLFELQQRRLKAATDALAMIASRKQNSTWGPRGEAKRALAEIRSME